MASDALRSLKVRLEQRRKSKSRTREIADEVQRSAEQSARQREAEQKKIEERKRKRAVESKSLSLAGLCQPCCDFISLANTSPVDPRQPVAQFDHFSDESRRRNHCKLCTFVHGLSAEHAYGRGRAKIQSIYNLNPHSVNYDASKSGPLLTFQSRPKDEENSTSKRKPARYVAAGTFGLLGPTRSSDAIRARPVAPTSINFTIIKEWLQFCKTHHFVTCGSTLGEQVKGLKLIDCETREVVHATEGCHYVALSYTWGASYRIDERRGAFPATIEDSMLATLKLGHRYLWVDKYCIDQADEHERHHQIFNMDRIYAMADLTIIAGAGDSPTYGLPGVSTRSRKRQRSIELATTTLVQIFDDRLDLRSSAWATRAWTFQEGYLARRRLIFTDHEVCYLCDRMYCQECVDQELQYRSDTAWDGLDASHLFGVIPNRHRENLSANQILEEYTGRHLSYPTDALNACLGILKISSIMHWAGLPVEFGGDSRRSTLNLQWANATPGARRAGFPSWSWTSVVGQKSFPDIKCPDEDLCTILLPGGDSKWQSVDQWMSNQEDLDAHQTSRKLQITAPFVNEIYFPPKGFQSTQRSHIVIQTPIQKQRVPPDCYAQGYMFKVHMDEIPGPNDDLSDVVLIFVQAGRNFEVPRTRPVLLLLKKRGEYYGRVGITDWNNAWCCDWSHAHGNWKATGNRWLPDEMCDEFPRQTIFLQ